MKMKWFRIVVGILVVAIVGAVGWGVLRTHTEPTC